MSDRNIPADKDRSIDAVIARLRFGDSDGDDHDIAAAEIERLRAAETGAATEPEEDIYDAVAQYRKDHPEPPAPETPARQRPETTDQMDLESAINWVACSADSESAIIRRYVSLLLKELRPRPGTLAGNAEKAGEKHD